MANWGLELMGTEALEKKLLQKSALDLQAVQKKQMREIYTRGQRNYYQNGAVPGEGGTPYDSGELRISMSYTGEEVGYTKDYAPHVEYGHRNIGGGFVPGQHFLRRNVDTQAPIYKEDLKTKLKE